MVRSKPIFERSKRHARKYTSTRQTNRADFARPSPFTPSKGASHVES
jgi:hypothetical protein